MTKCKHMQTKIDFSEWLLEQIKIRDISQSDLARASGLSRATISDLINRKRLSPDQTTLNAIAQGLDLPPDTIYRAAGLLPPIPERRLAEEIALYKLSELNDAQLDEVLQFIEFIQDKQDKQLNRKLREGSSPPEMVKRQI